MGLLFLLSPAQHAATINSQCGADQRKRLRFPKVSSILSQTMNDRHKARVLLACLIAFLRLMLYALLAGCGPLRAGEALGLEVGKHISPDCRTLYIQQKAKRGIIQRRLKTKNGNREVDLCSTLAVMLQEFIGTRTSGLLFQSSTGAQLLQSNTLQDSLIPSWLA